MFDIQKFYKTILEIALYLKYAPIPVGRIGCKNSRYKISLIVYRFLVQ